MITYIEGDATQPINGECEIRVIAHICNDAGVWGEGFVKALSKRWRAPEEAYLRWSKEQSNFALGAVQLCRVEPGLSVCNMIAQHGCVAKDGVPPIRYEGLALCLQFLGFLLEGLDASIHMPRIGCGRAGGMWVEIEPLLQEHLCKRGVPVFVYDLAKGEE